MATAPHKHLELTRWRAGVCFLPERTIVLGALRNAMSVLSQKLKPRIRTLAQAFSVIAVILFISQAAAAQSNNIYQIRGTPDVRIYHVNATTGVSTTLYTNYPGGDSATIAQRPSDGMLFYASYATNAQVYRYNPATPTVAPVALPGTLGAGVPTSYCMSFSPGGTLYYIPNTGTGVLYTINQATGVATAGPTITGLGTPTDMVFTAGGTLYIVNITNGLFTASVAGGAATALGTVTYPGGITPIPMGLAIDSFGTLQVEVMNPSNIYDITLGSPPTASNPMAVNGGTAATGDLASSSAPQPNLTITKTDGLTTVYRGGPVSYTIVVTNSSAYPITSTVADTVPASVTGVTWTCTASAGSTCNAASGAGNAINTGAMLLVNGTATYTVSGTLSAAASGNLVNTATVAPPAFLPDSNPVNNTATDTDTINLNANLAITKTDGVANITAGNVVTYTIVVSNAGPDASVGSIVTDNVPATVTTVTWTCGTPTGGATCGAASGSGNSISTTANLPSGSTLRYTVTGTLSVGASGTLVNTATIITPSGVSDPTDLGGTGAGNNSATDTDTITAIPYVKPQKDVSPSGASQPPGTVLVYTITFTNTGGAPAQSLVITDPFSPSTDFKLASESHVAPVTVNVDYWDTRPPTPQWVTVPTSDGSAPAGYARNITKIRWTFAANLAPGASATLTFSVRIP
jgi:uncharacterized repeat protein (TIGR01451 family)